MQQTAQSTPAYVTRCGAARHLSVSLPYIDKLKASGQLPFAKISSGKVLFKVVDLEAFVDRHRIDPTAPAPSTAFQRTRTNHGRFAKGGRE